MEVVEGVGGVVVEESVMLLFFGGGFCVVGVAGEKGSFGGVRGGKGGFFGVLEGTHKHLMLTFFGGEGISSFT